MLICIQYSNLKQVMKTKNKTKVIFLVLLASLVSIVYMVSQNNNVELVADKRKVILTQNETSQLIPSQHKKQINTIPNTASNPTQNSITDATKKPTSLITNNKTIIAADALPPQPLPEGHGHKASHGHQNMPPPAPDSKYAQNHQHTNRPDMRVVEKH